MSAGKVPKGFMFKIRSQQNNFVYSKIKPANKINNKNITLN